jgi:pilus assembly protein Flp/PilA
MTVVIAFWRNESGATAIEYALIAGFIALLIVAGATSIGTKLSKKLAPISGNLA